MHIKSVESVELRKYTITILHFILKETLLLSEEHIWTECSVLLK